MNESRMQQLAGIALNEGEWGFDKAGFDDVKEWKLFLKKWGFPNSPKTGYTDYTEMRNAEKQKDTSKPYLMGFYWENKKGDIFVSPYNPTTGKHYKSGSTDKGYMHYIGIEGPNAKKIADDMKDYETFFYDNESRNNRDYI